MNTGHPREALENEEAQVPRIGAVALTRRLEERYDDLRIFVELETRRIEAWQCSRVSVLQFVC